MCKHRPVAMTDRELADRFPSGDDEVVFRGSAAQARADSSVVRAFLGEAALA